MWSAVGWKWWKVAGSEAKVEENGGALDGKWLETGVCPESWLAGAANRIKKTPQQKCRV